MFGRVARLKVYFWSKGRALGPFGKVSRSILPKAFGPKKNFFFWFWLFLVFLSLFFFLSLSSLFLSLGGVHCFCSCVAATPLPLTKLFGSVPHVPSPHLTPSPSDGAIASPLVITSQHANFFVLFLSRHLLLGS